MKKYLSIILASVFLFACSPPDSGITSDIQTLDPGEPYSDHVIKINSNFANLNTDKLEDAPSDGSQYARQDGAWSVITAGGGAVDSVFGRTGVVVAESGDYASFYLALASCTTSGQIPKWNGTAWACETDETGSGSLPPGNATNDILQWDGSAWLAQGYINGLIDDTAGDGDTTAVLSANEINTRIAAVNEVPAGGTTGQVLGKASDTDHDTAWIDQTGSGGVTSIIAGTNITIDPASGLGDVTINAATDSVGGYVPVPTNSDSACTEGQYAIDRPNNFIYWCYAANSWDRVPSTFDQWDNPSTVYYTLTINPVPINGRVIEPGDSTNINCGTGGNDCEADYEDGTDAVLTAIAESGYSLDSWSGTNLTDNGDGTATIHIDQDISDVTATFAADSAGYSFHIEFDSDTDWSDKVYTIGGNDYSAGDTVGAVFNEWHTIQNGDHYTSTPFSMRSDAEANCGWQFDVSNNDLVDPDIGYYRGNIYIPAGGLTGINAMFTVKPPTGSDIIYAFIESSGTIEFRHRGNDGATNAYLITTSAVTNGQFNQIDCRWDVANNALGVRINGGTWETGSMNLDSFTGTLGTNSLTFGNDGINTYADEVWMDDESVWTSFAGPGD